MNETAVMTDLVPIRGLFETHLTVSDLPRSIAFYRDVVGLQLALEVYEGNAAFFWVGDSSRSMLGLWSLGTAPLGLTLHVAFEVALDDLLQAPKHLKAQGITPLSFFGLETAEPGLKLFLTFHTALHS
jgi:lactoylglutathione lyase